jgi:hypothetical protein
MVGQKQPVYVLGVGMTKVENNTNPTRTGVNIL